MTHARRDIDLIGDLSGLAYMSLLECGLSFATTALFVVRPTMPLNPTGQRLIEYVASLGATVEERTEWPGTKLLDGTAKVYSFPFNESVREHLVNAATGVFDWQQPLLPEDLALLRGDGTPWLTTISHEQDAFLSLSQEELGEATVQCRDLGRLLGGT